MGKIKFCVFVFLYVFVVLFRATSLANEIKPFNSPIKIKILPVFLFLNDFEMLSDKNFKTISAKVENTLYKLFGMKSSVVFLEPMDLNFFFSSDLEKQFSPSCDKIKSDLINDPIAFESYIFERIEVKLESNLIDFKQVSRFYHPQPLTIHDLAKVATQRYLSTLSHIKLALKNDSLPRYIFPDCWYSIYNLFPKNDLVLTNAPLTTNSPDGFHPDFYNMGMFAHQADLITFYPFTSVYQKNLSEADLMDATAFLILRAFISRKAGLSPLYEDSAVGCIGYVGAKVKSYAERYRKLGNTLCPKEKDLLNKLPTALNLQGVLYLACDTDKDCVNSGIGNKCCSFNEEKFCAWNACKGKLDCASLVCTADWACKKVCGKGFRCSKSKKICVRKK